MEVKEALGVAPGAVLVRSSSFPIEEWLFHFLHLSSLNRVQPALFFSDATVLFTPLSCLLKCLASTACYTSSLLYGSNIQLANYILR
jgi:hypothetical protein